ncbi:60 kDa jasmonate-induced protein [Zea mays]|uniref:ATP-dependent DNA helicase n=1 Tax=Zea mays TaxID=4577 RepID=A0A1D6EGD0_MAIZE|nr:60 kDa jasmonate-induced protein [Zea mays]
MAAATGYSDAPTDEQLLAYAELPRHGRYMAEVFAVRILATAGGDPPPHGTITFYGGHCCSDFIYSWSPLEEGEDTSKQTCDSQLITKNDGIVDEYTKAYNATSNIKGLIASEASWQQSWRTNEFISSTVKKQSGSVAGHNKTSPFFGRSQPRNGLRQQRKLAFHSQRFLFQANHQGISQDSSRQQENVHPPYVSKYWLLYTTTKEIERLVLLDIRDMLQTMCNDIRLFPLPAIKEEHDNMVDVVREIFEEMSIPEDHEAEFVVSSLNHEQRHAYDVILSSVENISGGVFFVDGPGGTGKTCMYKALLSTVRRSGKIAIATATSGVAASIMPGGRTASDSLSSCILVPKQGNLVLTGPSWATSAYSPIAFTLYLHDGSPQAGEAAEDDEDIGRIICDCIDGDFSNYNRAIVETVQTGYGPAEVIYAVLSNGVQGRVAIKLARLPVSKAGEEDATAILGRIVARSKLFDVGCVLFYKEGDNGVSVRPGGLIQLAREALAVPLHMPLTIELDLHRCSGDEIVGGVLEFNPATNGQHTERLVGENGAELEVTISWSQYPW